MSRPVLVVHGGAGRLVKGVEKRRQRVLRELAAALEEGASALRTGNALDAVVAAVTYMESCGEFNAGKGAVLNIAGEIELDAGVMWGVDLSFGAVACMRASWNAVAAARAVMEKTDHCLMAGRGADAIVKLVGLKPHPGPSERRVRQFGELRSLFVDYWHRNWEIARTLGYDTVGAAALDRDGNLAAAASTGGIWYKLPGRVGDSPLPGAGFYAENGAAAASATGRGEYIARFLLTARVAWLVKDGLTAQEAVETAIRALTEQFGRNTAGVVAVDHLGNVGMAANTDVFIRGVWKLGEKNRVAFLAKEPLIKL